MLEFDAGVIGRELPVGFGVMGVAVSLPSGDLVDTEWLGGLTILKHKSKIIGEQLGTFPRERRHSRKNRYAWLPAFELRTAT
jgi:hypothetical protein